MTSFRKGRTAQERTPRRRIARVLWVVLALAGMATAACGDGTGTQNLATLTVTPATATVAVNGTVPLAASGTRVGFDETRIEGETWTVTGGGTVSDEGLFTAGATPGTSTVTVTCGGLTSTATITVTAGPLASITVTPNPATLAIGAQQQFTAVGRDAGGNVVAITPVWSTTNPPGAINAASGLFTAGTTVGAFPNSVRATSGAIFGTATVNVTAGPLARLVVTPNPATLAIGAQQQFTAVGTDAQGNVVAITPVWSTTNPPGAINAATGLFTAGNTAGTFADAVTATAGSLSATATVIVTAGALATITVTPNPETLAVGAQQQFTAVGRDAGGNVVPIDPVWSTTNPPGTIDSGTGLFTAGNTAGTFPNSVRATQGAIFGTATVTVTSAPPAPLATITVTPNPSTLQTGGQQTFTAVGRDANGVVVPIDPTWSVTNGGGTIPAGSTGQTVVFTAGNTTGTFTNTVRATQGAIFGRATVIVTAAPVAPLATITVTPNPRTLETGDQQTFTAVGRDANGNVIPISPTWSVTSGGGTIPPGTVGPTALFTAGNATGTFPNTVRATQGAIFGTATVIVTAPPVNPPPPTPASTFRVLANTAVACTSGSISGDVGTFRSAPGGSFAGVNCPVTSGTVQLGTPAAVAAYNSFVATYNARETVPCGTVLTGTLAGVTLPPGVYCFDNAATLTGVLTLNGPASGVWLFKVGTSGVGALTGTGFSVVMAGAASECNVTWWVEDAATMTDSNLRGAILAGGNVTTTRGTLHGNAWSQGDVTITNTVLTACAP
ncbi:MAG TPA: ice-binding family protein [Longimicrobium sp.]